MKKLMIILVCLMPFLAHSQNLVAFRDTVKNGYNFWLYTPVGYDTVKNDAVKERKPLVIFLHGKSLCGSNLNLVRQYGCINAVEMGRKIDALILAPQNPGGAWSPSRVLNLLNWTTENYDVDTNRVYVIGMSLGGYGTIDFVGTYPEKIAAAMALCGGGRLSSFCGLTKVPLWIIHGTADKAVAISQSQRIVDAMQKCGDTSLLRFDKLSGVNHSHMARVLYLPMVYEWLFSHSLTDSPRTINRNFTMTPSTLNEAYQNIDKSGDKITVSNTNTGTNTVEVNSPKTSYHTVKNGDTLGAIARKYGTSVSQLCKINKIKANSILKIGQKIKLK
jgi:LysM repeat protein